MIAEAFFGVRRVSVAKHVFGRARFALGRARFALGRARFALGRTYGTLPGSHSVPGEYMTVGGGGEIRGKGAMERLYAMQSAPSDGKAITFCNTGHWASLGWFVQSEILGDKDTAMYDGSLAEWTTEDGAPMDRKVSLD